MGIPRVYSKAVHEESGWWGTFPLGLPLKVGDILQMDPDGGIIRVGNVLDWPGWSDAMPTESDPVKEATRWSRHATKTRAGGGEGGVADATGLGAQAAVKVSFSEAGGFVIEYLAGFYHKVRDLGAAQKAVLGLAKNGEWNSEHVLVTELVEATPATVLISSSSDSSIVLYASATLPGDVVGFNLADPKFGFSASASKKDVYESVSERAYPLFHCIKVRRNWWGGRFAELQGGETEKLREAFTDTPFNDNV